LKGDENDLIYQLKPESHQNNHGKEGREFDKGKLFIIAAKDKEKPGSYEKKES